MGRIEKSPSLREKVFKATSVDLRGRPRSTTFFYADFYCAEHKLVIELDGKIHEQQKYYDCERDLIIERLGLKVLRFKNEKTKEMDKLIKKIISQF